MPHLTVPGGTLQYDRAGAGQPACLIHQYQSVSATHDPVGRALARHFACCAINARGLGESSEPRSPADLTMEALCEDLETARQALSLPRWVVAGASTGGMVALLYALTHPDSVAGLILICTAASHRFVEGSLWDPAHPHAAEVRRLNDGLASGRPEALKAWADTMGRLSLHRPPQPTGEPGVPPAGTPFSLPRMMAFLQNLRTYDLEPLLHTIRVPTLVVAGRYDPICPPANSERIAAAIPGARLAMFEESGHGPYVEEPERFHAVLAEFVARAGW